MLVAGRASRKTTNENVTTNRRDRAAIRNEIVQCSLHFFQERMSVAQDKTITAMKGIIAGKLANGCDKRWKTTCGRYLSG